MEKKQIIKALECCIGDNADCNSCPYWVDVDVNCFDNVKSDALALIKQQDEQIFQLENRLKECENGYAGTLHIESCKLHDAEERVKELTEDNEAQAETIKNLIETIKDVKANTVREIFKEIYSSLDYIEEQMEPEEIPECFFSVREDINALKEKFESEGAEK